MTAVGAVPSSSLTPIPPPTSPEVQADTVATARAFCAAVRVLDGVSAGMLFHDEAEFDVPGARLRGRVVIRDCLVDVLRPELPEVRFALRAVHECRAEVDVEVAGRRRRVTLRADFEIRDRRIRRLTVLEHDACAPRGGRGTGGR